MTDSRPSQPAKPRKIKLDRSWLTGDETVRPAAAPSVPCQLKMAMPCCRGRGYTVAAAGPVARATLCSCVSECPACFGRARTVEGNVSKPCHVPPPNVVVNLVNAAQIPARYAEATLEGFQNFAGNGRAFLQELGRWKSRFTPVKGMGLVIEGPVGVGKTYILAALAKEFAERGMSVRFTDFFQLLGELKSGFSQGKADSTQLKPLIDVDVLFIDELGKGRNTDFELTVLDQLISGRYNQSKSIIATTNYKLKNRGNAHAYNVDLDRMAGGGSGDFATDRFEGLEPRIGPRIFSRLREMTAFMELTGDDFRRRDSL